MKSTIPILSTGYECTSPQTRAYNCIAWAVGDKGTVPDEITEPEHF